MPHNNEVARALELLKNSRSAKRRSGAKTLRKLKASEAGSELLAALQKEVRDVRTWETQYQMIMALAECEYVDSLPYLRELSTKRFEATMLYVALGDAIVRLSALSKKSDIAVLEIIQTEMPMLIEGSFRAIAILKLVPASNTRKQAFECAVLAGRFEDWRGVLFWLAAATPGWPDDNQKSAFLDSCTDYGDEEVMRVVQAAMENKYLNLKPL